MTQNGCANIVNKSDVIAALHIRQTPNKVT